MQQRNVIKITLRISLAALSACLAHCHFFKVGLVCLLSGFAEHLSCVYHSDLLQNLFPLSNWACLEMGYHNPPVQLCVALLPLLKKTPRPCRVWYYLNSF